MRDRIEDKDRVSHLIFSPSHYPKGPLGPIDLSSTMQFQTDQGCHESVNCERLYRTPFTCADDVGKFIESTKNQAPSRAKKGPVQYTGYKLALVKKIRVIKAGSVNFEIVHNPENDNYAHCKLQMILGEAANKSMRQDAIRRVQECFDEFVERKAD